MTDFNSFYRETIFKVYLSALKRKPRSRKAGRHYRKSVKYNAVLPNLKLSTFRVSAASAELLRSSFPPLPPLFPDEIFSDLPSLFEKRVTMYRAPGLVINKGPVIIIDPLNV